MVSCARATRGFERPFLGKMARPGATEVEEEKLGHSEFPAACENSECLILFRGWDVTPLKVALRRSA